MLFRCLVINLDVIAMLLKKEIMTRQLFLYFKSAQVILFHVEVQSDAENLDSGLFLPLVSLTLDSRVILISKTNSSPVFFRYEVQVY